MPQINAEERVIDFNDDDFEDIQRLQLAADMVGAIMFFPEDSNDMRDYILGAQLSNLLLSNFSPDYLASYFSSFPDFFWHITYRRHELEKKYSELWNQPRKGYSRYNQGIIAGLLARLLCTCCYNISEVYAIIGRSPDLILFKDSKGKPAKLKDNGKKTLDSRWQAFKHSSHFWWALDFVQSESNSKVPLFQAIRKNEEQGQLHFYKEKFLNFINKSSRLRILLASKRDPSIPINTDKPESTYQFSSANKLWKPLYNGKPFQSIPDIVYQYSTPLEKALTRQKTAFSNPEQIGPLLFITPNGDIVKNSIHTDTTIAIKNGEVFCRTII